MSQTTEPSTAPPLLAQRELAVTTRQPPRRLRALLLRLTELVVSIVVTAVLVELLVPLFLGEQPKFPRRVVEAPWGLRYNEPGARYRHKSADGTWYFHINNQGMRADRDYSYEKPAGVRRIIALGDSMTAGLEVQQRADVLQHTRARIEPGRPDRRSAQRGGLRLLVR